MVIDSRMILRVLSRLWWIPILTLLLGGILLYGGARVLPEQYTATTQLLIPPSLTDAQGISAKDSQTSMFDVVITSGPVLDRVILELGLDLTREELALKVNSNILGGGQIIEVTVTDANPQLAADIANSIARNFEVQIVDLTLGEFERNLDNLRLQSGLMNDQITVLDTRLAELDTGENSDDTVAQAEIRQLKSDRLQLAQNKADIDATIRDLNSQLSMSSAPVVVADFAKPADEPVSPKPLLIALFGAFLGGIAGVALLVYLGLRDATFRDTAQVVSFPVLARTRTGELSEGQRSLLATRLDVASRGASGDVVLVSPRSSEVPDSMAVALSATGTEGGTKFVGVDNLLESAAAVRSVTRASGVVVVAGANKTTISDLAETDDMLRSLNIPVLGTIVLK